MADEWYCEIAGREIGPLSSEQLRAMAAKAADSAERLRAAGRARPLDSGPPSEGIAAGGVRFVRDGFREIRALVQSSLVATAGHLFETRRHKRKSRRFPATRIRKWRSCQPGASTEILPVAQRLPQTSTTPASPVLQMPPVAPPMAADVFDPVALGILEDPATVKTETQAHAKSLRSREKRRLERQKMVVGVLAAAVVILAIGGLLLTIGGNTPSEQGHSGVGHSGQEDTPGQARRKP